MCIVGVGQRAPATPAHITNATNNGNFGFAQRRHDDLMTPWIVSWRTRDRVLVRGLPCFRAKICDDS